MVEFERRIVTVAAEIWMDNQNAYGVKSISVKGTFLKNRPLVNAFVGFIVGLGGGLVGLGGAELRLPYLVGSLKLPLKTAIPINLTISLLTILAALPYACTP